VVEREQIKNEIKRELKGYWALSAEVRQLSEKLAQLEAVMYAPSGSNGGGKPRSTGISNPVESLTIKHVELEQQYRTQLEKLATVKAETERKINGLESIERTLARYRYLDGMTWEQVCIAINYSWTQTHRIHSRVLDKLVAAEIERRNAEK
jgi:DNA-directed RNA polymerase specialized sigma subunit